MSNKMKKLLILCSLLMTGCITPIQPTTVCQFKQGDVVKHKASERKMVVKDVSWSYGTKWVVLCAWDSKDFTIYRNSFVSRYFDEFELERINE